MARGKSVANVLRAFVRRNHNKFSTLGVNMAQRVAHDFINVFLRVSHVYVCMLLGARVCVYAAIYVSCSQASEIAIKRNDVLLTQLLYFPWTLFQKL